MKSFKDKHGKTWNLEIDAPMIKRCRAALDVNLGRLNDMLYARLADDLVLLVDLLWVMCEKQAQERGIDQEQFSGGLVGDAIDEATEALLGAFADFTPGRTRSLVQKAISRTADLENLRIKVAMEKMADLKLEEAVERHLDEEFTKALTLLSSATSSPGSPASTQTEKP